MMALIIIIFFIALFFKLFWVIVRPIFEYVYYLMIKLLTSTGISYMAARAIISVIIIIIIVSIIF